MVVSRGWVEMVGVEILVKWSSSGWSSDVQHGDYHYTVFYT